MPDQARLNSEDEFRKLKGLGRDVRVPVSLKSHTVPEDEARNMDMRQGQARLVADRLGAAPAGRSSARSNSPRPAKAPQIETPLPRNGPEYRDYGRPTYKSYEPQSGQYGRQSTISKVEKIAEAFAGQNPMSIYVGDISKKGGGYFPPHSTHRDGDQVDIRPVHNFGIDEPVSWESPNYNQTATMMLIHEIKRQNPDAVILFNDPKFVEMGLTKPYDGHDNHMHINFGRKRGR